METTTTETQTQAGKAAFIPVPLDKMKVGHAGLYVAEEDEVESVLKEVASITGNITNTINDAVDTTPIVADIELGIKGAAKTLIDCEGGIKAFVKELAEDKENGLPNKETGIWIHYLTQGIMNDFHRTWTRTPVSLEQNKSRIVRSKEKGKRVLSKKEKNELLAKLTYQYYEDAVNTGEITQAEAFAKMAEAAARKKELEDAGYYLSPNKTQGVALFDWKSEVADKWGNDISRLKIYNRHSVIPLVPCFEDKMNLYVNNKVVRKEVDKSILNGLNLSQTNQFIESRISGFSKLKENYEIKTLHIAKINQSGKMKDRWFVVDAIRKADKKQVLLMWDKNGLDGMLE